MLDKIVLKDEIIEAMNTALAETNPDNREDSMNLFASNLADAIDRYVKTATVTVIALTGEIQVQGTPSAQANIIPIVIRGEPITGGLS